MSIDRFPELSALRVELVPRTRDQHLVEIVRSIRSQPVGREFSTSIRWRRWAGSLAATLALLTPAVAIAADGAMPGDALYPLKRAFEGIVRLVDRNVVAEHRIEELELIIADDPSSTEVMDLLSEARRALSETDSAELVERLAAIEMIVDQAEAGPVPTDSPEPADVTSSDRPVVDGQPADDGRVDRTTRVDDETPAGDETAPTESTVAPVDRAPAPTIGDAPPSTEAPADGRSDTSADDVTDRPGDGTAEMPAGDGHAPEETGSDSDLAPSRDASDHTP